MFTLCEKIRRKTIKLFHDSSVSVLFGKFSIKFLTFHMRCRYEQARKWDDILAPIMRKRIMRMKELAKSIDVMFGSYDLY